MTMQEKLPYREGYAVDNYAPEGHVEEANIEGGYYDEDYVYASWRLELDCSLLSFLFVLLNLLVLFNRHIFALRLQCCLSTLIVVLIELTPL